MSPLSAFGLFACAVLAVLTPARAGMSYSSWMTTTFPSLSGLPSNSPSVSTASTTSTVNVNSAFNGAGTGGSPFNSVYGVSATVSSASNLAYPFTSQVTNQHPIKDFDTGIDVLAGGQVTFRMPTTGTGTWCFELGRSLAGQSFCSGPAGYFFDYWNYPCAPARQQDAPCPYVVSGSQSKCNNSMINGAWISTDRPNQGSALSFTYARSGALMARVGQQGQTNQIANENPNDPFDEYFSAFDNAANCPTAVITSPYATSGASNTYTLINSGRLYLAIFRWNFFPGYANGSVNVLIDYVSPMQVAVSSSNITGTNPGSAQHPVVVTATQSSSTQGTFPTTVTIGAGSPGTVTTTGYLPVLNLTGLTLNPASANAGSFVNSTAYTWYGPTNQVSYGQAAGQNQTTGQPWLSAYLPPAVALSNTFSSSTSTVGVDMSQLLTQCSSTTTQGCSLGFLFPATVVDMVLDPYLQQYYPPCSNDYDCDYDSGINIIEGGTLTLTSRASDQWCFPNAEGSYTPLCSNAAGNSATIWDGCSNGGVNGLVSNGTINGIWPNTNGYDNSGCNSDSDMQAPIGAVAFRIAVDTTSMKNAGYLNVEYHSYDYYYAFPNAASNGLLSYTFTAPNSGRLYLAFQGPQTSNSTSNNINFGASPPYSGFVRVTAVYTPPPNLMLGLTWSPNPNNVVQPYLFAPPSSPTATSGLVSNRYLPIPDTVTSTVTATFWVYQQVFNGTASGSGSNAASAASAVQWYIVALVALVALVTA